MTGPLSPFQQMLQDVDDTFYATFPEARQAQSDAQLLDPHFLPGGSDATLWQPRTPHSMSNHSESDWSTLYIEQTSYFSAAQRPSLLSISSLAIPVAMQGLQSNLAPSAVIPETHRNSSSNHKVGGVEMPPPQMHASHSGLMSTVADDEEGKAVSSITAFTNRQGPGPTRMGAAKRLNRSPRIAKEYGVKDGPKMSSPSESKKINHRRHIKGTRAMPTACFFCRGRKIHCGRPAEGSLDQRCNQCRNRSLLSCEYPLENRRGQRPKKVADKPIS